MSQLSVKLALFTCCVIIQKKQPSLGIPLLPIRRSTILRDSDYKLSLFDDMAVEALKSHITIRRDKHYVNRAAVIRH